MKSWSCTKSSVGLTEKNSEASSQHVFIYLQLSSLSRTRSIDDQLLDFAFMTSYLLFTFKWTNTNSVLEPSQYQARLVIEHKYSSPLVRICSACSGCGNNLHSCFTSSSIYCFDGTTSRSLREEFLQTTYPGRSFVSDFPTEL